MKNRTSAVVWLVLSIVMIVGYSWWWSGGPVERSDSSGYYEMARDLEDWHLEELQFRAPGYPVFLRMLGYGSEPAGRLLVVVGLALHMLSAWLLARVLNKLEVGEGLVGVFVALALSPPFVQPAVFVLSENLTQFLLAGGAAALCRWLWDRRWATLLIATVFLSMAAWTRPTYQALAPLLVLCALPAIWKGRRSLRRVVMESVVLAGVPSAAVAGLAFFNLISFGQFTLSPGSLPYSLSTKTVRVLEQLPDEYAVAREVSIRVRDEHLVRRGSSHTAEQYYPAARAAVGEALELEGEDLDAYMLELNLELIAAAPLNYLYHVGTSAVSFWFPTADTVIGRSGWARVLWAGVSFLVFGWFFLQMLALAGIQAFDWGQKLSRNDGGRRLLLASPVERGVYLVPLGIVLYTFGVSCGLHHGEPRFRTTTELLIVFGCVFGTSLWLRSVRQE